MLNSIGLENYKSFKNSTSLKIAPLTVLCGINSSGKSSLIKSILMLKQTASSRMQDPAVVLSGDYVDCGTFADVVNDSGKARSARGARHNKQANGINISNVKEVQKGIIYRAMG